MGAHVVVEHLERTTPKAVYKPVKPATAFRQRHRNLLEHQLTLSVGVPHPIP